MQEQKSPKQRVTVARISVPKPQHVLTTHLRDKILRGDIAEARTKLAVLRRHCDAVGRDYATIEKTHCQHWLLARDAAALAVKRERQSERGPLRGFIGTVSEAIDLIGQYRDAGIDLLSMSWRAKL